MQALRQTLAPLRIALVRLAARPGQVAVVGGAVAASAAAVALLLGASLVVRDRAFARALAALPASDRAIQVAYFGVPPQGGDFRRALDPPVVGALASHLGARPTRALLYRRTRIGGVLVNLGAVDSMERWVRLRSGRFPRSCTPARCEVVEVGGAARVQPIPGVRLVPVGRGELASPLPFGRLLPAADGSALASYGLSPEVPPTLLLAEGVSSVSALPALESRFRSYLWTVPLGSPTLHAWESDALAAAVTRLRSELEARSPLFDVTAPTEELAAAASRGRVSATRFLLVGGQVAALLLAFAVLAGTALRRDAAATWQRLTWLGARRWQLALATAADAGAVAIGGTLAGWSLALGLVPALAASAGSPAGTVLTRSLLSAGGLAAAAGVAALAAASLLLALRLPALRLGSRSLTALDAAALGAAAAVALALARGRLGPGELARESGTVPLLLLLPGLVALIAGVSVARILPPALRALQRLAGATSFSARLALLSLARSPGRPAVAAAFVAVSIGLAVFAAAYRSTLAHGRVDQARFAYPLDFVLREDLRRLVRPLEAAPLERFRALGEDVRVVPAIRARGSVSRLAGVRQLTLLGVPAGDLPSLSGWRDDFSALSLDELAGRLAPAEPVSLAGPSIPSDARELRLPYALRGDAVALGAAILTRRGDFVRIDLGELRGGGHRVATASLPRAARGGRLVALRLSLTRASQESGGPEEGRLSLGRLAARTRVGKIEPIVSGYRGWVGLNGIEADGSGALRYFVTNLVRSVYRPVQPTDGKAVPVATTPELARAAGPGGILPLQLAGGSLRARVVATVARFPSLAGELVVADERLLFAALNADAPGTAVPNEIWLGVPPARVAEVERALRRPPFDALELSTRRALETELETDPLARGVLAVLASAAGSALALGLAGLLLLVLSDLRDERGQLFDLEAEGADRALLRRLLRLRTLTVAGAGLVGGLVLGAALSLLVVGLVEVTAGAEAPEPPLRLALDWGLLGGTLLAYATGAALVAGLPARWAFRSAAPERVLGVEA